MKILGTLKVLLNILIFFPFEIKKKSIDVIRATDPYYSGLIGLYISLILGVPLVISIHSDYDKRYSLDGIKGSFGIFGSRKLGEYLERFVLERCNYILPIRKYMINYYINKYNLKKDKFYTFPHVIDLNKFDTERKIDLYKKFQIPKNKKIISFVGRVSNENFIYDILKIAEKVINKRDDIVFILVGGGNEFQKVKKLTNNNSSIICLGFQKKNIVINVQKQTSISICLMGGFSLIEACAASNPIISYNIEWHNELIKTGVTGFLAKQGDINYCVTKILELLEDDKKLEQMGCNARGLVEERHEINNTIKIKKEFYRNLFYG